MTLVYLLVVLVGVNCSYYLFFSSFSFYKPVAQRPKQEAHFPVSLIVCAKNEAAHLRQHIPYWLEQEYKAFELILVNDASSDETLEVMEAFAEKDSRIRIVNVKNIEAFWANKKYALTLGIKKAVHTRLIFTDADCRPASKYWLQGMAAHFSEEKHLVLGYGAYSHSKGFLNRLIRFETALAALQYFSYALRGIPYMGVGRNLAYSSQLFYNNKGFMSHVKIPSGDDDLFVNEAATATNTALCLSPDTFTYSTPKKRWSDWFRQKRRHITTASHYKTKHKLLLSLFFLSSLLFWPVLIFTLFTEYWVWGISLGVFRFLIQAVVYGSAFKKLKEQGLLPWIPLLELFLLSTQLSIFISNIISKPPRWK